MVVLLPHSMRGEIYVNGVLYFETSDINTYMLNTTTVTELRFGDFTGANVNSFPSGFSDGLGGWYARLDSMWIANGAAFDQAQVTELLDHKTDFTQSDNYSDFTTYAQFDAVGVTSVLGSATYGRGDNSF